MPQVASLERCACDRDHHTSGRYLCVAYAFCEAVHEACRGPGMPTRSLPRSTKLSPSTPTRWAKHPFVANGDLDYVLLYCQAAPWFVREGQIRSNGDISANVQYVPATTAVCCSWHRAAMHAAFWYVHRHTEYSSSVPVALRRPIT